MVTATKMPTNSNYPPPGVSTLSSMFPSSAVSSQMLSLVVSFLPHQSPLLSMAKTNTGLRRSSIRNLSVRNSCSLSNGRGILARTILGSQKTALATRSKLVTSSELILMPQGGLLKDVTEALHVEAPCLEGGVMSGFPSFSFYFPLFTSRSESGYPVGTVRR